MHRRKFLPTQAKEFLNYCDAIHKPSTVNGYTSSLRRFYIFIDSKGIEREKVFEFATRALFEEWFPTMLKENLMPASRFLATMNIRSYLKWAADRGYLKENPEQLIRSADFPKRPTYLPKPLEPQHDKKLIEYLKTSDRFADMGLLLLRWGGMRVGELRTMPWDALKQEEDGTHSIYVPPCKLNHDRLVPLTEEAAELAKKLQAYPSREGYVWKKEYCEHCDNFKRRYQEKIIKIPEKLEYLMTQTNGLVISYSGMRTAMNRACKAAGIPHYCVHQLRHTFATSLLNAGVSLISLMKLLGHKKIEMTLRYAQVVQETVRREYFDGMNKIVEQYDIPHIYKSHIYQPLEIFLNVIQAIEKKRQESNDPKSEKKTLNFLKRLRRMHAELCQYV